MNFADAVKQDTPRLVVIFERSGTVENFRWGLTPGSIPLTSLIGCVMRVQMDLLTTATTLDPCPESALVIAYDAEKHVFDWFIHPDVPRASVAGFLEVVKASLVMSGMQQMAPQQRVPIFGPDGQPVRR